MNIYGRKVVLRAMEPNDCELVSGMFNDPEIENLTVGWSFPLSQYAQAQWYEKHYGDQNFRFVIETKEDGAIGIATLVDIDWKNRSAEHGIKLAQRKCRGKGYGIDTVMAIMRYSFDELGLNRLNGAWFEENIPSRNMYMKCGWKEEGKKRQAIYKRGVWHDLIMTGILAEEYRALICDTHYWDEEPDFYHK